MMTIIRFATLVVGAEDGASLVARRTSSAAIEAMNG
jgi:hypothetical protein